MKTFFLSAIMMVCIAANAQFTLSPDGFVSEDGKNYIVKQYPGKTKQELYTMYLSNITSTYRSQKDVASRVKDEAIGVHALARVVLSRGLGISYPFELYYNLNFNFKDGRVRIEAPTFDKAVFNKSTVYLRGKKKIDYMGSIMYIYKNEELAMPLAKENLEKYFNNLIGKITSEKSVTQEEW